MNSILIIHIVYFVLFITRLGSVLFGKNATVFHHKRAVFRFLLCDTAPTSSWGATFECPVRARVCRFPHAAESGYVRVQRQNRLPAQARRSATQRQEVRPILRPHRHGRGQHADHKGMFMSFFLPNLCCAKFTSLFCFVFLEESSFVS